MKIRVSPLSLYVWYNLFYEGFCCLAAYHCADKVNATLPVEAPPTQVEENVPTGQTALAARIQPSQRPLLTLIVAPGSTALSLKRAVPAEPVVDVGAPPHLVIAPAMPPLALVSTVDSPL